MVRYRRAKLRSSPSPTPSAPQPQLQLPELQFQPKPTLQIPLQQHAYRHDGIADDAPLRTPRCQPWDRSDELQSGPGTHHQPSSTSLHRHDLTAFNVFRDASRRDKRNLIPLPPLTYHFCIYILLLTTSTKKRKGKRRIGIRHLMNDMTDRLFFVIFLGVLQNNNSNIYPPHISPIHHPAYI